MFNNLCQIARMIAETFGPGCETVVHDCDRYENFIAAIYNGHVSGRKRGEAGSRLLTTTPSLPALAVEWR